MDKQKRLEIEAASWRKLVSHFQKRTDVQNIDLMNMAGFCRNCFSKWYMGAAKEHGEEISYDEARKVIYGMSYNEWKDRHQSKATEKQLSQFNSIEWGKDTTE